MITIPLIGLFITIFMFLKVFPGQVQLPHSALDSSVCKVSVNITTIRVTMNSLLIEAKQFPCNGFTKNRDINEM